MKTAIVLAAVLFQASIVGNPPAPHQTFLPFVAKSATWTTVMKANGKPFTDVVSIGGSLFVSRQDGVIFKDGTPWMTVPVDSAGEAGLNALATDGTRLWAGYVSAGGNGIVASINPATKALTPIADFGRMAGEHNMAGVFYTNGKLIVGLGDNEDAWTGQSATLPNGKLWMVDPVTGEAAVVAKGVRNPWVITSIAGQVMFVDVGETKFEEVNAFTVGANYGWPCFEGLEPRAYDPETCDALQWVTPVAMYGRSVGRGVVGVAVLNGVKVFADFDGNVRDFGTKPVKKFDGFISKMSPIAGTAGDVAVLTFQNGTASVNVYR